MRSKDLLSNPARVALPDSHAPMSAPLEKEYHLNVNDLIEKIKKVFK